MKKVLFVILLLLMASTSYAKEETNAVMSKSCDEAKVRELAGEALIKIVPQEWAGGLKGFNITLDTSKLTFADLTKKMMEAGCFQ